MNTIGQTNSQRTCKPTSFCLDHQRRFTCHFLNNVAHYFVFFPAWLISTLVPIFNHHLCEKATSGRLLHEMITKLQHLVFATCWVERIIIANYQISMLQKPQIGLKQFFVQQLVHILKVVILKSKIEPGSSTGLVNGNRSGCHHNFENLAFRCKLFQMQ